MAHQDLQQVDNIITHERYLQAVELIEQYRLQCEKSISAIDDLINGDRYELKNTLIIDAGLKARTYNALKRHLHNIMSHQLFHEVKVKDLSKVSSARLLTERNVGKGTIKEIYELCERAGVKMLS